MSADLAPLIDAMVDSHREPPPGVLTGNDDLGATCAWVPTVVPQTAQYGLPGREHLQGADLDLVPAAKVHVSVWHELQARRREPEPLA